MCPVHIVCGGAHPAGVHLSGTESSVNPPVQARRLPEATLSRYNYFYDTKRLRIDVSNMMNLNSQDDLSRIRTEVLRNVAALPPPSGAAIGPVPAVGKIPDAPEPDPDVRGGGREHDERRVIKDGYDSDEEPANGRVLSSEGAAAAATAAAPHASAGIGCGGAELKSEAAAPSDGPYAVAAGSDENGGGRVPGPSGPPSAAGSLAGSGAASRVGSGSAPAHSSAGGAEPMAADLTAPQASAPTTGAGYDINAQASAHLPGLAAPCTAQTPENAQLHFPLGFALAQGGSGPDSMALQPGMGMALGHEPQPDADAHR
jgi:hypothetical protein